MTWVGRLCAVAAIAWCGCASAQTETPAATGEPVAAAAVEASAPATFRIPAGTAVQVEITEALSSESSLPRQVFNLRLAEPIVLTDGRVLVPAGVIGGGEVVDAHPSAFGGRQGRLILSGRFLEIGGQRVRIRSMQLNVAGADRSGAAMTAAIVVGVPAFLIQGNEVHIPVGTRATARLAVDVDVPVESLSPPAAPASEATQPIVEGENQQ
jgi:hypothetical protein